MSVEQNVADLRAKKEAALVGDAARVKKQRDSGKLLARERVALLLDEGSFFELDALSADAGVVAGSGLIEGRAVYVYAQDFTVKGGSMGLMHARKVAKVMDLARKTGAPIVSMCDSGGARLDEGADALNAYAEIAARSAQLSGVVPQICMVLGPCAGVAAFLPAMSDICVVVKGKGQILTMGPQVVSATTGKELSIETLGGAAVAAGNGTAQLVADSEPDAFAQVRKLLGMLPLNNLDTAPAMAEQPPETLPAPGSDARAAIAAIADAGDLVELSAGFAPEAVTAFARIAGRAVGFAATQPGFDGGRLTENGCRKLARFVRLCDCYHIPVVTLCDSEGLSIVGPEGQGGLVRAGGQLLYAYAEASCPKLTLVTGQAIGAAYVALAAKGNADATFAWPGSVIAPLGAPAAVQVLYHGELAKAADPIARRAELEQKYEAEVASGYVAAVRGYVDDVIEPSETRAKLAAALDLLSGKRDDARPARKHGNLPL